MDGLFPCPPVPAVPPSCATSSSLAALKAAQFAASSWTAAGALPRTSSLFVRSSTSHARPPPRTHPRRTAKSSVLIVCTWVKHALCASLRVFPRCAGMNFMLLRATFPTAPLPLLFLPVLPLMRPGLANPLPFLIFAKSDAVLSFSLIHTIRRFVPAHLNVSLLAMVFPPKPTVVIIPLPVVLSNPITSLLLNPTNLPCPLLLLHPILPPIPFFLLLPLPLGPATPHSLHPFLIHVLHPLLLSYQLHFLSPCHLCPSLLLILPPYRPILQHLSPP